MCKTEKKIDKINFNKFIWFTGVTPRTRGSVDYPSTRGIQVEVGLPDATLENRAESPLYGELYPNTKPVNTCPKQSNIRKYNLNMSKSASWAHKPILIKTYQLFSNYLPIIP